LERECEIVHGGKNILPRLEKLIGVIDGDEIHSDVHQSNRGFLSEGQRREIVSQRAVAGAIRDHCVKDILLIFWVPINECIRG